MSATAERAPAAPFLAGLVPRQGVLAWLGGLGRIVVGSLLCLHPLTAVLVLGWLMRLMRSEAVLAREDLAEHGRIRRRAPLPNWLFGEASPSAPLAWRVAGALWSNLRWGLAALATIAAGTLPFTLLWLLSWWGGWENSFNKGYEQAWVGPVVGMAGVALALMLLARMPMALAHQAAEARMSAFFAGARVRQLIRLAGWRYVWLTALAVLAALPLFVLKSLPVFVEEWSPGFIERNPDEVETFARRYRFWASVYMLLALVYLRRRFARLEARAALRLEAGETASGPLAFAGWALRSVVLWVLWFGLVAQIYVGQFVNHQWASWLNPPLLGLPWLPPMGVAL